MLPISDDRVAVVLDDRARLWKPLRNVHRLLTGVNEPGRPPKKSTPLRMLAKDLGLLGASLISAAFGAQIISSGLVPALIGVPFSGIGILVAVGRLRRLVVGHVHESSHGIVADFYRKRGWPSDLADRAAEFILDIGTAVTFTTNGQEYRATHPVHHEFAHLGTLSDPDGALLKSWHIWPDEPSNLRTSLLATAFSPRWHMDFFRERVISNLARGKGSRRALGGAMLGLLLGSAFLLPLPVWIAAVFLPFVPGLQIATLLQLATIHPYGYQNGSLSLDKYAQRTWERVPYTPMPGKNAGAASWARWMWSIMGHAVARATVLDSTMVAHGYHHTAWLIGRPFEDWWNTGQYWIDAHVEGVLPANAKDRILWGLPEALQRQEQHFEELRS